MGGRPLRDAVVPAAGILLTTAYALFIAWLYTTRPRSLAAVATEGRVAVGLYEIDRARFQAGRESFRREQYAAARREWEQADPARRDAAVQFYVAYSYYREGWGRLRHDDALYRQGLQAVERAESLGGDAPLRIDDEDLGLRTPAELRDELTRGVETTWSDFNPWRVLEKRK